MAFSRKHAAAIVNDVHAWWLSNVRARFTQYDWSAEYSQILSPKLQSCSEARSLAVEFQT
jgi:hypothetical protein